MLFQQLDQGFYSNRVPNFGQTTLNSDAIMLHDIHQVLELKSLKRQLQLKILYQNLTFKFKTN